MLIDRTYFVGQLLIPNALVDDGPVAPVVDNFIAKYEPTFLRTALGYELYKAMLLAPTDQRFVNILSGCDYTDLGGRPFRWRGFIETPSTTLSAFDSLGAVSVKVDGPQVNGAGQLVDPVAGTSVTTIPDGFVGKKFSIEQRGLGMLVPPDQPNPEYSVTGNQLTLLNGVLFVTGDTFFYKTAALALNTSPGDGKLSIIANWVYYWYMRDNATQTAAMGEVITQNENSTYVNPGEKMARAMSELWQAIKEFVHFMNSNRDTYPEWASQRLYILNRAFSNVNEFGI